MESEILCCVCHEDTLKAIQQRDVAVVHENSIEPYQHAWRLTGKPGHLLHLSCIAAWLGFDMELNLRGLFQYADAQRLLWPVDIATSNQITLQIIAFSIASVFSRLCSKLPVEIWRLIGAQCGPSKMAKVCVVDQSYRNFQQFERMAEKHSCITLRFNSKPIWFDQLGQRYVCSVAKISDEAMQTYVFEFDGRACTNFWGDGVGKTKPQMWYTPRLKPPIQLHYQGSLLKNLTCSNPIEYFYSTSDAPDFVPAHGFNMQGRTSTKNSRMRVLDVRNLRQLSVLTQDFTTVAIVMRTSEKGQCVEEHRLSSAWPHAVWQHWVLGRHEIITDLAVRGVPGFDERLESPCLAFRTSMGRLLLSGPYITTEVQLKSQVYQTFRSLQKPPQSKLSHICYNERTMDDSALRLGAAYEHCTASFTAPHTEWQISDASHSGDHEYFFRTDISKYTHFALCFDNGNDSSCIGILFMNEEEDCGESIGQWRWDKFQTQLAPLPGNVVLYNTQSSVVIDAKTTGIVLTGVLEWHISHGRNWVVQL